MGTQPKVSTAAHARLSPGEGGFARLVIESGDLKGMIYPLNDAQLTLGRGPENAVQIIDTRISRVHVQLEQREGHWTLNDLQSRNGTLVNDSPIATRVRLVHGDRLLVGDTQILFEQDRRPAPDFADESSTSVRLLPEDSGLEASAVLEHPALEADPSTAELNSVPSDAEERLRSILQVGKLIQSILDLDELLEKMIETVCAVLEPTNACILLRDEDAEGLVPKVIRRPPDATSDLIISGSIIQQAMDDRVAVLMEDPKKDDRFAKSDSIAANSIQSAICAPLISKGEVFGALYLDRRTRGARYVEADLEWAFGVASQAALAIDVALLHRQILARHERQRDLEIARQIQMNLLPNSMPKVKGFEFGGLSEPARMVGGDYFDIIPLAEGDFALAVVDVSGKGVPSAILLASVRSAIRMESRSLPSDGILEVIRRLNETIYQETMSHMFVSMVLAYLEPETSRLTYCNAGHLYPLLRHPDGTVERLEAGCCFLGIMPGIQAEKGSVKLEPGSLLVLVTDGVTDALNPRGESYGQERLDEFIASHADLPAQEFCDRLRESVAIFQGSAEQFDDLTVMAVRAL